MSDINRTIHIGRMTDSPELKYTPNNVPVCKFILAVNEVYKNSSKKEDSAPAEEQNQNDNPENQPAFDDCFPVQE
jgi:single-stranded DNA-binding protein